MAIQAEDGGAAEKTEKGSLIFAFSTALTVPHRFLIL
jgi:hypothetical protein